MDIVIGRTYERHFRAAYRLVDHLSSLPAAPGDTARFSCAKLADGSLCIRHAGNRYRLDLHEEGSARFDREGADVAEEEELGFRFNGGTWFRNLREGSASADAEWQSLLEAVATAYHKQFSILEYTQEPRVRADDERTARAAAAALAPLFGYTAGQAEVMPVEDGALSGASINIYGLTLRVLLGDDEPIRVICRIFFRERKNGEFEAMDMPDAMGVNELLGKVSGDGKDDVPEEDSALRNNVLDALQRFLADPQSEQRFSRCIFFDETTDDEQAVSRQANLYRTDGYDLICREVRVLGISHLKWESALFDIGYGQGRALRLALGLNDSITVTCANCGAEEPLIENNTIRYADEEGKEHVVTIDPASEEGVMGLDEETVEKIRKGSEIAKHLHTGTCGCVRYSRECGNRLHCDTQLFPAFGADKKTHMYCKDCPYPEVVFMDPDSGERRVTSALSYFHDEKTMREPSKEERPCRCCRRLFAHLSRGYCPTCGQAQAALKHSLSAEGAEKARKEYRRYAHAVGLGLRMRHAFDKKYCFEDDGILLFALGKKLYLLDKLLISERGFLKPARPVQ